MRWQEVGITEGDISGTGTVGCTTGGMDSLRIEGTDPTMEITDS